MKTIKDYQIAIQKIKDILQELDEIEVQNDHKTLYNILKIAEIDINTNQNEKDK